MKTLGLITTGMIITTIYVVVGSVLSTVSTLSVAVV